MDAAFVRSYRSLFKMYGRGKSLKILRSPVRSRLCPLKASYWLDASCVTLPTSEGAAYQGVSLRSLRRPTSEAILMQQPKVPSLSRHKASSQGVVRLNGRDIYL